MKKIISTNIDAVRCVIGQSTRKPNAVTMVIEPSAVIEAVEFYESRKRGIKPKDGLIGYELVAVYAGEVLSDIDEVIDRIIPENILSDIGEAKENPPSLDIEVVEDKNESQEKFWLDPKCPRCGNEIKGQYLSGVALTCQCHHGFVLPPKDLPCVNCTCSEDGEPCKLECKHNPNSESLIDLFESVPMSMRL